MSEIIISDETARVCLRALGELPFKLVWQAFNEISQKMAELSNTEPREIVR